MARIQILQLDDPSLTAEQRRCLEDAAKVRGRPLNIHKAMANRPAVSAAFQQMVHTVYRGGSTLDTKHGRGILHPNGGNCVVVTKR